MSSNTRALIVEITRYVDGNFPGWVECEFTDAAGRKHRLIDKVPILSNELLDDTSDYPVPGIAGCEILDRSHDEKFRELVRITIQRPVSMESTEGLTEFIVLSDQLESYPWPHS